jgi:DNA-binding MarR family transcriptional regulator
MIDKKKKSKKLSVMPRMGIAFLTWRRHLQKGLVPYKITLKQLYVLNQLIKKDFLYPSEIAELLFCDRPTATVILKNLERQGWIKKIKDPDNKKWLRVIITDKGKNKIALVNRGGAKSGSFFNPISCFSNKEIAQLEKLLIKLNKHMDEIK